MSSLLASLARIGAYLITLLLAAVWVAGGLESLMRPLFDLGRPRVGDAILAVAGVLFLSPDAVLLFAQVLAGLKLMVGLLLLVALIGAFYEIVRWGESDDAILDVALLTAATASVACALPGLMHGGEPLQEVIGELMLCVIASWLAIHGRGYLAREELPRPTRPAPGYARVG